MEEYRGRDKWISWLLMSFGFFIVCFNRYALAVISNDLASSLELSGVQLSNLVSMYFYSYGLMQIPVGFLVSSIGPRKLTIFGMTLCGITTIVFATTTNIYVMYISRFLFGIGGSAIFLSVLKFLMNSFSPMDFIKVNGWTGFMGNLGGLVATLPFATILLFITWRTAFFILGLVSLFIAIGIWYYVKEDRDSKNKAKDESFNIKDIVYSLKVIAKDYKAWIYFFMLFFIFGTMTSFVGLWGIQYVSHVYKMSDKAASNYILFYTLGFIIGSLVIGYIEKKFTKQSLLMRISCFFSFVIWFVLIYIYKLVPPLGLLKVIFFLLGFLSIFAILVYSKTREVNDEKISGPYLGLVNVAPFLGSIIINLFVGIILDKTWTGNIYNDTRYYTQKSYFIAFNLYLLALFCAFVLSFFGIKTKKYKI